jgi:hypothetical protein
MEMGRKYTCDSTFHSLKIRQGMAYRYIPFSRPRRHYVRCSAKFQNSAHAHLVVGKFRPIRNDIALSKLWL